MINLIMNLIKRMRKNPKNDSFLRFFKSDLGSVRTHTSCGIAGGMGASRTREIARKIPNFSAISNEIRSYFVPEKIEYNVVGECKKCGQCCNYMYSFDTYTEQEFKFMQALFPSYKRFYIKGKDEDGNFIFACKYVSKEGLCTVYNKRLKMCKIYPHNKIIYPAKLHENCGYTVVKKGFEDYLK